MAKISECDDIESVGSCEDEEMKMYRKKAVNVTTFRIVRDVADLDAPHKPTNSFKPEMAHQIFGETEAIFGYKQVALTLYYLHNSAKCYVDLVARDPIEAEISKPDNIMKNLEQWLPTKFRLTREEFVRDIEAEEHGTMHGTVLATFGNENHTYKITECCTSDPKFQAFHERFETYIYWFIDGANAIDLNNNRWMVFYVYEESVDSKSDKIVRSPIGFCTVYKFFFFPDNIRPRISQFFILPTHQKRGIGTKLYTTIFHHLKQLPESVDITVEEPTEIFQRIRDLEDTIYIYDDLKANKININARNQKFINAFVRKHKMCKLQAQRVFDILEGAKAHRSGHVEYKRFADVIKQRIEDKVRRDNQASKRIRNVESLDVNRERIEKIENAQNEYAKYMESLEWPINRLIAHLAKSSP